MNRKDDKIRAFFAIEIPDDFQKWIEENVIDILRKSSAKVKWVARENIHITLRFIGEIEKDKLSQIVDNVDNNIRGIGKIKLELSQTGYFGKKFPRVLWVGLDGDVDKLEQIHERIELACRGAGIEPDDKKFSPHITIGRVKSPSHTKELIEAIGEIEIPCLTFETCELALFKSTLTPEGPIYNVLKRIKY